MNNIHYLATVLKFARDAVTDLPKDADPDLRELIEGKHADADRAYRRAFFEVVRK